MYAYKRTPIIALILAGIITLGTVIFLKEFPGWGVAPLSKPMLVLLYFISLLPANGIAMLFDPLPRQRREKYMKVNFYDPDRTQYK